MARMRHRVFGHPTVLDVDGRRASTSIAGIIGGTLKTTTD